VSGGIHVCITGESRSITYFQYQIRWFAVKRPSTNTDSNASIGPILSTGLGMTYQVSLTGYTGGYSGQNCNAIRNSAFQLDWNPGIQYTVSTQKSW